MAAEFYLVSELAVNHLPPFSDDLVYGLRNIKETAFLVSNLSVNCVFRIEVCTNSRYNSISFCHIKRDFYEPYRRNFAFVPYRFKLGNRQQKTLV